MKTTETTATTKQLDYEKLYKEECAKNKTLESKITEYEKLCKSFSEQATASKNALQNATLEYDARTKYMLDCVRHAYISIQLSANTEQKQGGTL